MLKNYLKIMLRNIRRYKGYAFINTAGLAIGMACCLLTVLYIQSELSFDRYHEKAERIYLLKRYGLYGGKELTSSSNNALSAVYMKKDFPEVETTVRIGFMPDPAVRYKEKKFYARQALYADGSFFEIFTYAMLKGDPKTALVAPFSVVITEEIAARYFGPEDPLGKSLRFNNRDDYTVTGVIKNVPRNSHLLFDMLCSFQTQYSQNPYGHPFLDDFTSNTFRTYVLLRQGADPRALEAKFPAFIEKYGGKRLKSIASNVEYFLMPLTKIHLYTPLSGERTGIGAILYIYIFSLVAVVILVIACINFMNLATARSTRRAQEVGVRKVLGAVKAGLVRQFLGESFFYSFLALFFAVGLAELALPIMSSIVRYELSLNFFNMPWLIPALLGITLFVGFAAGSYPALYLAAFQPVRVLKGGARAGKNTALFRSVLVVLQFTASVALMIGTVIIVRQLAFMKNKNPGFNKEQVVVLPFRDEELRKSLRAIKTELRGQSGIVNVSVSSAIPGQSPQLNSKYVEGFPFNQPPLMYDLNVDEDFIRTMGMEVIAGRDFSPEFGAEREAVLINEAAAKQFGWDNPIGKKIGDYSGVKTVVGVVRDYHQLPLTQEIRPLLIRITPEDRYNPYQMLSVRITPGNIGRTLHFMESKWNQIYPHHPFDYFFLDESFGEQFQEMERAKTLTSYFAGLAIFIACLGLYGLASFMAEQRTKEIGIRKVLGATTSGIVYLISMDLAKMVALANAIAWPIAYLLMRNWLSSFPYRAKMTLLTFLLSGAAVLFIGLATVSYQSIKAGLTNPVDSLKYE